MTETKKRAITRSAIVYCVISLLFLTGCTTAVEISRLPADNILPPPNAFKAPSPESEVILSEIRLRNSLVEDSQEWIGRSYNSLQIRGLNTIPEKDFANYAKYLENEAAYVMVHPAFFTFFHTSDKLSRSGGDFFSIKNVVEKFIEIPSTSPRLTVLQAQERRMRDFIEFKSTQKKLLIIVLPKNYQNFSGYVYKKGLDEYTRFLNEITNGSESVIYVQSKSANRGYLGDEEMHRLMEFLLSINAKRVLVGGGYIGRCLEGFYVELSEEFGGDGVYVVPELADISPKEINPTFAMKLLRPDGTLDIATATEYLKKDIYNVQSVPPRLMNLQ